jgi:hypothetical protein
MEFLLKEQFDAKEKRDQRRLSIYDKLTLTITLLIN